MSVYLQLVCGPLRRSAHRARSRTAAGPRARTTSPRSASTSTASLRADDNPGRPATRHRGSPDGRASLHLRDQHLGLARGTAGARRARRAGRARRGSREASGIALPRSASTRSGSWASGSAARPGSRSRSGIPGCSRTSSARCPASRPTTSSARRTASATTRSPRPSAATEGLAAARKALAERGVGLILDFVPNHVAPDHPWTGDAPRVLRPGQRRRPCSATRPRSCASATASSRTAATRTSRPGPTSSSSTPSRPTCAARRSTRSAPIADQCDGVRCDMAMLMMNDVFERTWGERAGPRPADDYWPTLIADVKRTHPGFVFMAEAYWDLEYALQQQGFDYCYDKRLYDRLVHEGAESVRGHLTADIGYQERLVRFVENHDEPRAAATFAPGEGPCGGRRDADADRRAARARGSAGRPQGPACPSSSPAAPRRRPTRPCATSTSGSSPRCATPSSAAATGSSETAAGGRATTPGRTSSSGVGAATARASSSS